MKKYYIVKIVFEENFDNLQYSQFKVVRYINNYSTSPSLYYIFYNNKFIDVFEYFDHYTNNIFMLVKLRMI